MQTSKRTKPRFNVERIAADIALRGWNQSDLARAAGRGVGTIHRFMTGDTQTSKVAADIAKALGYTVRRYFSHVEAA